MLKTKQNTKPRIESGPEIFCPCMDLSSWLPSSLLLLTAAFFYFAQMLACKYRQGERRDPWQSSVFIWRKTQSRNVLRSCPDRFAPNTRGLRASGGQPAGAILRSLGYLRALIYVPPPPSTPNSLSLHTVSAAGTRLPRGAHEWGWEAEAQLQVQGAAGGCVMRVAASPRSRRDSLSLRDQPARAPAGNRHCGRHASLYPSPALGCPAPRRNTAWISWTNPRSRHMRRLGLVSRPGVLCPGKGADRHCVLPLPPGSQLHVFPLLKPSN